ncbi:hypothetical protein EVA_16920 [gut metagenome]|uniref:Uncharacterized protein n=1 Tax=gut metagenome TaxID=749906 RepID=J9G652_9ZZZZ
MILLLKSFPHQSHHIKGAVGNAQRIDSVPGINGCMGCFSLYGYHFCCVTVAGGISKIKLLLNGNHVHMGGQDQISLIKDPSSYQLAFP